MYKHPEANVKFRQGIYEQLDEPFMPDYGPVVYP